MNVVIDLNFTYPHEVFVQYRQNREYFSLLKIEKLLHPLKQEMTSYVKSEKVSL